MSGTDFPRAYRQLTEKSNERKNKDATLSLAAPSDNGHMSFVSHFRLFLAVYQRRRVYSDDAQLINSTHQQGGLLQRKYVVKYLHIYFQKICLGYFQSNALLWFTKTDSSHEILFKVRIFELIKLEQLPRGSISKQIIYALQFKIYGQTLYINNLFRQNCGGKKFCVNLKKFKFKS